MKRGKNVRASQTWQMIGRRGIIDAVERVVTRSAESMGYTVLVEMGMQDKAFEAVVLRHPDVFSTRAVERSTERMRSWSENGAEPPNPALHPAAPSGRG